jgi:hypothetical protein
MASSNDIVTIQNIDDEDFVFEYARSEGNPPYTIPAGAVKRYPRFLAEHAVKHLIDKILNKGKIKTNNMKAREELASQIVLEVENLQPDTVETPAQKLNKEVDTLNKPSDLDTILKKRKESPAPAIEVPPADSTPAPVEEKFEGQDEDKGPTAGPEVDTTDGEETQTPNVVKAMPTRAQLYEHATKGMNMVLDDKTKARLDKMKISELIKELQYPID